ncbi:MAG: hypothetical protein KF691_10450 [Phycisphaeraceae bacterium]|nr:hypothetical protein [Phycisphaeraceae bacterium]
MSDSIEPGQQAQPPMLEKATGTPPLPKSLTQSKAKENKSPPTPKAAPENIVVTAKELEGPNP